jgi:hypothetical protein
MSADVVIGIDEAGRGAEVGPLVMAALLWISTQPSTRRHLSRGGPEEDWCLQRVLKKASLHQLPEREVHR